MSLDWAAGFFDGEGTVGFWNARSGPNSKRKVLSAAIAQNDRRPLDKFVAVTNIGIINGPYKSKLGTNVHYRWSAKGTQVLQLFTLLSGKLVGKQEQFDRAVAEYREYQSTVVRGRPKTRGVLK